MTRPAHRELRWFIAALLGAYCAKQLVLALLFPPFTGHDEVAHYAYIRVLATEGRVPTLFTDTLPPDLYRYKNYAIEWDDQYRSQLYTAVHPPLYYALMTPLFRQVSHMRPEAIQYFLRCALIPLGAAVVYLAYKLAQAVFPGDAFLAVTVPGIVAFQPQVSYEASMVNNDMVAIALYSWLLYVLILVVRDGASTRRAVLAGVIAGMGLLAKGTAVMSLVLIPAAFALAEERRWRSVIGSVAVAYGVTALLAGPWWWFMIRTYGDPMAVGTLAATQPDLIRTDATFLDVLFSGTFLAERWAETWGEFGWKLVDIGGGIPAAIAIVAAAGAVGLATYLAPGALRSEALAPWQGRALVLLVAACVLSYVATVQFGTTFTLAQARYYFPIVNAAALCVMAGLRVWIPGEWRGHAQAAILLVGIIITIQIYTAHVVPYWYFRA